MLKKVQGTNWLPPASIDRIIVDKDNNLPGAVLSLRQTTAGDGLNQSIGYSQHQDKRSQDEEEKQ